MKIAQELDQLRAAVAHKRGLIDDISRDCDRAERALEQAEARVDQLTDTLALRSDALNRTGESNDRLRALLLEIDGIAKDAIDDDGRNAGWAGCAAIRGLIASNATHPSMEPARD